MAGISDEDRAYLTPSELADLEELEAEGDVDYDNEDVLVDPDVVNNKEYHVDEEDDTGDDKTGESDDEKTDDEKDGEGEGEGENEGELDREDNTDENENETDQDQIERDQQTGDDDDTFDDMPSESIPLYNPQVPENWKERLGEIEASRNDLEEKFEDGDIDGREYRKNMRLLDKEEMQIEMSVREAKMAYQMEMNRSRQQWIDTVDAFLKDNKIYRENEDLYYLLDARVKQLAAMDEYQNKKGHEILRDAHKGIKERNPALFGETKQEHKDTNNKTGEDDKSKNTEQKPTQKAKKRDVPTTLKDLPSSEIADTEEGGKFKYLDELDGVEFEDALAKLSDREREEYLSRD